MRGTVIGWQCLDRGRGPEAGWKVMEASGSWWNCFGHMVSHNTSPLTGSVGTRDIVMGANGRFPVKRASDPADLALHPFIVTSVGKSEHRFLQSYLIDTLNSPKLSPSAATGSLKHILALFSHLSATIYLKSSFAIHYHRCDPSSSEFLLL